MLCYNLQFSKLKERGREKERDILLIWRNQRAYYLANEEKTSKIQQSKPFNPTNPKSVQKCFLFLLFLYFFSSTLLFTCIQRYFSLIKQLGILILKHLSIFKQYHTKVKWTVKMLNDNREFNNESHKYLKFITYLRKHKVFK